MGRAAELRAIFCLCCILQGVECPVSLSFSVPFLSAISCAVYDLGLSVSYLWAQFILLNKSDFVLTSIKNARALCLFCFLLLKCPMVLYEFFLRKLFGSAASLRRIVLLAREFDLPKIINVLADYALSGV